MEVQVRDESRADGGDDILVPFEDVREHLVVVGNGMAGCRAVEELLARDAGRYRVTIFGAEPYVNYNRIMLSPVLAGEKTFDEIIINDRAWYADNRIDLRLGFAATSISSLLGVWQGMSLFFSDWWYQLKCAAASDEGGSACLAPITCT